MGQLVSDVTDILDSKKSKTATENERRKILEQIATDEKAKTNLVKKTLAAQRAQFGASGMSTRGMTEESVLKRLRTETEESFNEKKKSNIEKLKNLKAKKPNLLKSLAEQLDSIFN